MSGIKGHILPLEDIISTPKHFLDKLEVSRQRLGHREGPYLKWMDGEDANLDKFHPPVADLSTGVPNLSYSLCDLETGIACIAGKPNHGKSTFIVQCIVDLLRLQDDVIVLDFSFDDPHVKRITQYVANLSGLRYHQITTASSLHQAEQKALADAFQQIRDWYASGRLSTYDSIEISKSATGGIQTRRMRTYQNLIRALENARAANPKAKIVAFVDSWSNLDASDSKGYGEVGQANNMLEAVHEMVNKLGVILLASVHLRKLDINRRIPTLDDMKGTNSLAFDAQWTAVLINEVKDDQLEDPLTYEYKGRLYPIAVIKNLKNKVSGWDEPLIYGLLSDRCRLMPLTRAEYLELANTFRSNGRKVKK